MSEKASRGDQRGAMTLESGLESCRHSREFQGSAESFEDHDHSNNHFALIYESRDEQFETAIPFIRQGLERGEQCLYVADENSRDNVQESMRAYGLDVDAHLDSGALSILTPADSYRRTGEFDRETMLEFWENSLEQATDKDNYAGIRAAAEMTWALDDDTNSDQLIEYEAMLNSLYQDEKYVVLCQYNRKRFSAAVIHDVIKTHPYIVSDGTVSQNVYYTPPEKFFGTDRMELRVDRMMQTLQERTEVKTALEERERYLRELNEITASTDQTYEEKLQALFELGRERFDMELGAMARVDTDDDWFEVEYVSDNHENFKPGVELPLSETYCTATTEIEAAGSVSDPEEEGYGDITIYQEFGIQAYLGTYITVDSGTDRTFFFVTSEPRVEDFTDDEREFIRLMGQWVQYELERRQREQELRDRTDHLSALVETTPDCIKTVAEDGTLLQMNPAGLEIGGADSASDVIGECIYDFIAPEHREMYREFNERICQGERGTLEFDIIGLEGTRRHLESHAAPLDRPAETTVQVAVTRDITEQVERERELERALDLLERTERIADVGGWEIDTDTQEVFWTDHLFDILEVDSAEEPPLEDALSMYHENDRSIVEDAVENALESGTSFDVEARIWTDRGEIRWLHLQGVPEIVDGDVVSLRGAAQDITERKEHEQRLEELVDRLEESNERLEQFAYAASHDLQEPLRMVSSYLQLIEDRYEDALDEDGQEFIEFAVEGANRMRKMIEGLLQYSRVETEGDPLEPIDLQAAFDNALSDLQLQIEESDAVITTDELPHVEGDSDQLRQVFQNLLSNAIEYSGDDQPRIHVSVERDGSEWIVSVHDEGIGIDPDSTDQIFEVFQRLHSREQHPGTGIGLSLCERIVERHGGDIWVESEPDEGSTFFFTLKHRSAE